MEPGKVQKNAGIIADIKDIRSNIEALVDRINARYNADSTNRAINMLRYADYELQSRMVELGLTVKLEDGNEK